MKQEQKALPMVPCKRCEELVDSIINAMNYISLLEKIAFQNRNQD